MNLSFLVICKKELRSFFSSATGYIVIALFLLVTSLFLWVLPGSYNVFQSGYANLDGLFIMAPWLYLFLCPAVTMRLFAEERQQGTLELLLTRPIGRTQLIIGKLLAGWLLVIIALLPCIVWYGAVNYLAEPMGNVDQGAFWGSFIGLVFLALVYSSVGLFASSVSKNQIVAFILGALLCFALYYGFELIASMVHDGSVAFAIGAFGINSHYQSISRGVVDSRDLLYFLIITTLFVFATRASLRRIQ